MTTFSKSKEKNNNRNVTISKKCFFTHNALPKSYNNLKLHKIYVRVHNMLDYECLLPKKQLIGYKSCKNYSISKI